MPTTAADVERLLAQRPVDHRTSALIHCETVDRHPQSAARRSPRSSRGTASGLIVDAMSSFGALPIDARTMPFDALVAASGKCIEGPPGMGFVFVRKRAARAAAPATRTSLALDLHDQWAYMEKTTQWRFTPPTHVVVALDAALDQYVAEGGQPARLARYTRNCEALVDGMARARLPAVPRPARSRRRSSSPSTRRPMRATRSRTFYERVRDKGFILYPGKLTQVETFRVGCIGAIGPRRDAACGARGARHARRDGHPHGHAPASARAA